MYLHDDDEAEGIYASQVEGLSLCRRCPGVTKITNSALREMQEYLGTEVTFYFAWAAFYTRYLWPIALFGVGVTLADLIYFRPKLDDDWSDDSLAYKRFILLGAHSAALLVWAALFEEKWKVRSKMLALDWAGHKVVNEDGHLVSDTFRAEEMRHGFYTKGNATAETDVWVELRPVRAARLHRRQQLLRGGLLPRVPAEERPGSRERRAVPIERRGGRLRARRGAPGGWGGGAARGGGRDGGRGGAGGARGGEAAQAPVLATRLAAFAEPVGREGAAAHTEEGEPLLEWAAAMSEEAAPPTRPEQVASVPEQATR